MTQTRSTAAPAAALLRSAAVLALLAAVSTLGGCTVNVATCGDGVIQASEDCDPPGAQGCGADCSFAPLCGDFLVTPPEACEPPNTATCSSTCTTIGATSCGDGVVTAPEQCEPPNTATCSSTCTSVTGSVCGDGVISPPEQCEPPGTSACASNCMTIDPAVCGNGVVEPPEQCDPPDGWSCSASCTTASTPVCGDGIVTPPEQCDPPDGWTCDFGCRYITMGPYCGNGILEPGELCEPPDGVTCDWTCLPLTPGTTEPGGPCVSTSDCAWNPGQAAYCYDELSTGFPGGFCLVAGCVATAGGGDDCPGTSACLDVDDGAGGTIGICLATCDPTSGSFGGCRADTNATRGYSCLPDTRYPDLGICYPGCMTDTVCNWCNLDTGLCNDDLTSCSDDADCALPGHFACDTATHMCYPDHPAGAADIGDPCTSLLDCPANADCLEGAPDYPGGYCSVYACGSYTGAPFACPAGSVCPAASGGAVNACAATCTVDGGNSTCDSARGDSNDYECADLAIAPGAAASSYYAATGAAGFCWQCPDLVSGGAGCP